MVRALLICTALAGVGFVGSASAQHAPGYAAPKTTWGVPDIQGFWNSTSITSLQRPRGVDKLVVTEKEGREIVENNPLIMLTRQEEAAQGSDPNDLSILADKNADRGYNAFWIDPGTRLGEVRGELRTSWITEPANGRVPFKPGAQRYDRGHKDAVAGTNFDGPETRPLFERCLMTETTAGPIMQNAMYNSTLQIVQSPDAVMIVVEMVHHARVIPIVANAAAVKHGPKEIPQWAGDSVGWYEGDTLVVETRNVNPLQPSLISPTGKLTERFSRWSKDQVLYEFTVEDPTLYTQTWKGEMALNTSQPLYEFACHEGNYAMPGILAGARELEAKGIKPTLGPGISAGLPQTAN
ncbi:MAG TPA: hypothetical protein PLN33_03405 [Hyphomonadaceae bacterium]|jgi:hypothetical protein|nr:hypothetical protein [Hyphomonadaceae bacterium]HPN04967.1 hypothetical protein [Hyphomonadaceae bacterium]